MVALKVKIDRTDMSKLNMGDDIQAVVLHTDVSENLKINNLFNVTELRHSAWPSDVYLVLISPVQAGFCLYASINTPILG